ncbi:hypothetical protein BBP40_004792 [Aspergillus hancockii]|nr:hypothetical protein BBP40_004792 [Aspergillus hancockii]
MGHIVKRLRVTAERILRQLLVRGNLPKGMSYFCFGICPLVPFDGALGVVLRCLEELGEKERRLTKRGPLNGMRPAVDAFIQGLCDVYQADSGTVLRRIASRSDEGEVCVQSPGLDDSEVYIKPEMPQVVPAA